MSVYGGTEYELQPERDGNQNQHPASANGHDPGQFAELNNITRNHLAKLECGLKKPSIELLVTFSENTGRSLDYLITGKNTALPEIKGQLRELIESLSRLERQI